MPVRLDADGNIVDQRTTLTRQSETDPRAEDETEFALPRRTADIARPADTRHGARTEPRGGSRDAGRDGAPTTPARSRQATPDSEKTRLFRQDRRDAPARDGTDPAARHGSSTADDPMIDPPVGWLVIVDGPGKGRVATLGMGVNSIGRDPAERVSLDYGDAMISRTNHGAITYDPRGQKFYVQHGGGTNLTYVNDEPVLEPRELEPLTHVQIGNTVLRFVPLCGVNFSWQDEPDRD